MQVSHYGASWVYGSEIWPEPSWPLRQYESAELRWESPVLKDHYKEKMKTWEIPLEMEWNKERLKLQLIDPWKKLQQLGVGVHVGEFGAFNNTPHNVVLSWFRDMLGLWKHAGWGWAMWNFRGGFPYWIVNAKTSSMNFMGHKLDREMLELLKEFNADRLELTDGQLNKTVF
jgi:endoglucanase